MAKIVNQILRMSLSLIFVVSTILCILGLIPSHAWAIDFMEVEEVISGLKGYALTVVEGTEIEEFEVEVLSVLEGAGQNGPLILVKVYGEVIVKSGGIAAGMSGSPVYIDGRLLGAISHGFAWGDHNLGLVTPITSMLQVMNRVPTNTNQNADVQIKQPEELDIEGYKIKGVAFANNRTEAQLLAGQLGNEVLVAYPVQMPLMVNGLGKRSMDFLRKEMDRFNILPLQSGAIPLKDEYHTLEPGGVIGVQLVKGDIDISGLGTLTYLQDDRFLAFGHEFLNLGNVNFFATAGYIHTTVSNLEFPFKVGAPLNPIGSVSQDRRSAIAGVIGELPSTVNFTVTVKDKDTNSKQSFRMELAKQDQLLTSMAIVTALEAIDRGIDRIGDGTAKIILQIAGEGWPKRIFRDNMYYSSNDIATSSLVDLFVCLQTILSNPFIYPDLSDIKLDIEIEQKRNTATIIRAEPNLVEVRPGNSVDVIVDILPYRGQIESKLMRFVVPTETKPGELDVYVRGGGFGLGNWLYEYYEEPEVEALESDEVPIYKEAESFEKLLDLLIDGEKNNEILIVFYPLLNGPDEIDEDDPEQSLYSYYLPEGVYTSMSTRYVIEGGQSFTIMVLPSQTDETITQIDEESESLEVNSEEELNAEAPSHVL